MTTLLQFILLLGIFMYTMIIHKKINSPNHKEEVITPSSLETKSTVENIKSDIPTENKTVKIKRVDSIQHKEKIKNVEKKKDKKDKEKTNNDTKNDVNVDNDNDNQKENINNDESLYIMTEERLKDIENNEEDKEYLKQKIAFEKQLENESNKEEVGTEDIMINYSEVFSQERKKKISEDLLKNTDLKWYEQNVDGSSIEKILPQETFKVEEYKF